MPDNPSDPFAAILARLDAMAAGQPAQPAQGQPTTPTMLAPTAQPAPAQPAAPDLRAMIAEAVGAALAGQQAAPVPAAPTSRPISDKGSPAPGGVLDWEREFAENPIGMGTAARQRMNAKFGVEKARRMRLQAAQESGQAEKIRVTKPER